MILTIDLGNTRCKLTSFVKKQLVQHCAVEYSDLLSSLEDWLSQPDKVRGIALCNVGPINDELLSFLENQPIAFRQLLPTAPPAGIRIAYRSPHTLGADRLAAVLGARSCCGDRNLLVIDVGTCVTFDLLTAEGVFWGGNISPGIEMRLKAMHQHTYRLPLVSEKGEAPILGYNTETALRSGAFHGLAHEIEGYARHWQQVYPDLCVWLTGGTAPHLPLHWAELQIDPYLVARGLLTLF